MLASLFKAKSVAVVGASNVDTKIGCIILRNLMRAFKGGIYPINPNYDELFNLKCYPTASAVNKLIDVAVIAVPAEVVPKVLESAANAKNVVIISSGFSEVGNEKLASQVLDIAKKNKQRVLGPNCIGIQVPKTGLDTTFLPELASQGNVAFVSQSGGFGSAILNWSKKENIGFSAFVSVGNMSDLDFADFIEYLNKDVSTKVMALYIESVNDGRRFLEAAKKCKKPIIAFKIGKTEEGKKAALTHTGSMAGSYGVYKGAFRQASVIEAESTEELFDLVKGFSLVKKPKNNKLVIITNSGGPGTAGSDAVQSLDLVKYVDLGGDATVEVFRDAFKTYGRQEASFLVTVVPTAVADTKAIGLEVKELAKRKPTVASFLGCSAPEGVASYETPERAVRVLERLRKA